MKKIIILAVLAGSQMAFALSESRIHMCKISANINQKYGRLMDLRFQVFEENTKSVDSDTRKVLLKKLQNEHEDYKDAKFKEWRLFFENKVNSREMSVSYAESLRMIMEAGVDDAYSSAIENAINKSLGRPEEHYYRKIYDHCTRG